MRCLYLGNFECPHCTERWVARAFERLGHTVKRLSVAHVCHASIVEEARKGGYDLLLGANFMFSEASGQWPDAAWAVLRLFDAIRARIPRIGVQLWDLMCPEFSPPRWEWSKLIAPAVDLYAMTDGHSAARLNAEGHPNVVVIRDGCPDDVDTECEWSPPLKGDVLFVGSVYGDRKRLVDALFRRFGHAFRVVNDVRGASLTRLVRSYRIVVGPHYPMFPRYWSDRLTVLAGHGALMAVPAIEGMADDGWHPNAQYVPLEPNVDKTVGALSEIIRHPPGTLLDEIRRAGFRHAQTHCTWDIRVNELLSHLPISKPQAR